MRNRTTKIRPFLKNCVNRQLILHSKLGGTIGQPSVEQKHPWLAELKIMDSNELLDQAAGWDDAEQFMAHVGINIAKNDSFYIYQRDAVATAEAISDLLKAYETDVIVSDHTADHTAICESMLHSYDGASEFPPVVGNAWIREPCTHFLAGHCLKFLYFIHKYTIDTICK